MIDPVFPLRPQVTQSPTSVQAQQEMMKRVLLSLTKVFRVHETLQPPGPVAVLLSLGGALLVHVSCYIWSQELRLQLAQRNVDQRQFGACAIRQTT